MSFSPGKPIINGCFFALCCLLVGSVANASCPVESDASLREPVKLNSQGEFVPGWAKQAVWYQIFPERFRDGDPSNNPTRTDLLGSDPQEPPAHWELHPWGSDWYELRAYEKANGEPELWKHLLRRRYGGDLQGIIDKLDYIRELGINAIYLNPVFDSPSLHKYDGASFHHIDPNFGPDPEGDRKLMAAEKAWDPTSWVWTQADELVLELIEQAHKRDIRIIFDGVFNHMGINSFAFQDVRKRQQQSPYSDWFTVTAWDDEKTGTEFTYDGWFGVQSLPEFAEDENGLAKGPGEYVFAATERWMNPKGLGTEHGVDGWRLDVAFCVAHGFWKDWRKHVKSINPDAYLTAELVLPVEQVQPYLQGDEFDGEMNYNFAFASAEFFFGSEDGVITASQFDAKLEEMRNLYPKGVAYATQNLFGSHDSNRVGSHIVNRGIGNFRDWGRYFQLSQAANNPDYQVRKPDAEEVHLQKLFAIFQMTYVGAPMIYYGDEVGMWGANDPDNRKPMIWSDIQYADEKYNPDGITRTPDKVAVDKDLLRHYRTLIHIRRQYPALSVGSYRTVLADDATGTFVFARENQGQSVLVVLNNSDKPQIFDLPAKAGKEYTDVLNDFAVNRNEDRLKLTVPAKWGAILLAE